MMLLSARGSTYTFCHASLNSCKNAFVIAGELFEDLKPSTSQWPDLRCLGQNLHSPLEHHWAVLTERRIRADCDDISISCYGTVVGRRTVWIFAEVGSHMTTAEDTKELKRVSIRFLWSFSLIACTYSHLSTHGVVRRSLHELGLNLLVQKLDILK